MYDPTIGRWLTEDPLGFGAGDANLYRYVGNRQTNAVDPSGLQFPGNPPPGNGGMGGQGGGAPWPSQSGSGSGGHITSGGFGGLGGQGGPQGTGRPIPRLSPRTTETASDYMSQAYKLMLEAKLGQLDSVRALIQLIKSGNLDELFMRWASHQIATLKVLAHPDVTTDPCLNGQKIENLIKAQMVLSDPLFRDLRKLAESLKAQFLSELLSLEYLLTHPTPRHAELVNPNDPGEFTFNDAMAILGSARGGGVVGRRQGGGRGAFRSAKRDAGIPRGMHPTEIIRDVPMTDRNGHRVLRPNGLPILTREYVFKLSGGKTIVIQDHSAGHQFCEGGRGDQGPHFNVRPGDQGAHGIRGGRVGGTLPHYPFDR